MDTSNIIKGDDLMIFIDNKAIAFATSHTITLSSSMLEVKPKIGCGNWSTGISGFKSWECSSENLYAKKSIYNMYGYDIIPLFLNGTPVDIKFTIPLDQTNKIQTYGFLKYNESLDELSTSTITSTTTTTTTPSITTPSITTPYPYNKQFTPNNTPKGMRMLSGKAIITNLNLNANSGDNATMSISLKGISPITIS